MALATSAFGNWGTALFYPGRNGATPDCSIKHNTEACAKFDALIAVFTNTRKFGGSLVCNTRIGFTAVLLIKIITRFNLKLSNLQGVSLVTITRRLLPSMPLFFIINSTMDNAV
jgi:hypothetical protein